jgi:hypothetical protein
MWRAITTDDLYSGMNEREITAVRTTALNDGQSDPVVEVISQVTLTIREAIRSCKDNRLSPDSTEVPEAAILHAVPIIRHRLGTRFGGLIKNGEDRLEEYREANRYLKAVASCAHAVERWGDDEDAPAPKPGPTIQARSRRFTRDDQEGI